MYKKNRTNPNPTRMNAIPRSLIVPDRLFTVLSYSNKFSMSVGGVPSLHFFSANGLYEPDLTGLSGQQPVGYDELATLYKKYRVFGSTMKCTIIPDLGVLLRTGIAAISDQGAPIPNMEGMMSNAFAVTNTIILDQPMESAMSMRMTTDKFYGITHYTLKSDDRFGSLVTGPPDNEFVWEIMLDQLVPGVTTLRNVTVLVTIEYEVEFYDRIAITPPPYIA